MLGQLLMAETTNTYLGLSVSFPDAFSFSQQTGMISTFTLDDQHGGKIVVESIHAGAMSPGDLLKISLEAFRRARFSKGNQELIIEGKVERNIMGQKRFGKQVKYSLTQGLQCSEFYTFIEENQLYEVAIQWAGITETNIPLHIISILDSMKYIPVVGQP